MKRGLSKQELAARPRALSHFSREAPASADFEFGIARLRAAVERNKTRRRRDDDPPAAAPAPVEPRGGGGGLLGGAAAMMAFEND